MHRVSVSSLVGSVLGLAVGLTAFAVACHDGPDLAYKRPWRASSSVGECRPEKRQCGGQDTSVFFMTQEEDEPWFVVDLGEPVEVSRVDVRNRVDAAQDAAVPLVVETSVDGVHFDVKGHRDRAFGLLAARFSPTVARYVRLRVARHSVLHLESVAVR